MKVGMQYTGLVASEELTRYGRGRIKISDTVDVLSCEAIRILEIKGDTFAGLRSKATELENRGYTVCIDLGADFYETP